VSVNGEKVGEKGILVMIQKASPFKNLVGAEGNLGDPRRRKVGRLSKVGWASPGCWKKVLRPTVSDELV